MAWLFLSIAIVVEVTGTLCLRLTHGFTRPLPSAIVVIAYTAAFVSLSKALQRGMPLTIAYGVWCAAGVCLVALASWLLLGESLGSMQIAGLVLVAVGVAALELGTSS